MLAFAGGVGLLVYLIGWALTLDAVDERSGEELGEVPRAEPQQQVALGLMFLGLLVFLREVGLWFGDAVLWPVAFVAFGLAVSWDRSGEGDPAWWAKLARQDIAYMEGPSRGRILMGAVLMVGGLVAFFTRVENIADLGLVIVAVVVTAAGFMLVFGPWVLRLARDLTQERRERIRSEERAEVAAHLHDSVLQTLALIQRTDDPKRMITLARAQERELRTWLYGTSPLEGVDQLSTAVQAVASKVEDAHNTPVEVVTVGDCPIDEKVAALVQASGEAMTNAAKHSGAGRVSVYVEVGDDRIDAWISDQGDGFVPDDVAEDRRGIADSIVGRIERHGGSADITSDRVDGTEVHLSISRGDE